MSSGSDRRGGNGKEYCTARTTTLVRAWFRATVRRGGGDGRRPPASVGLRFTPIVDIEWTEEETTPNGGRHRGGTETPPTYVADLAVDTVRVANVGRRGMERFEECDIGLLQTHSMSEKEHG